MYSISSKFVKLARHLQHWGCSPTYPSSTPTLSFGARWVFSEFLKDPDIWPQSTFIGPIDPNNGACQYAECNLIVQSTLLELVGIKCSAMFRDSKICSINRYQAIISFVIDEVIFKNGLQQKYSEQPNVSIKQPNKS